MASFFRLSEQFLERSSLSLVTIFFITSILFTLPLLVPRKRINSPPSLPKLPIIGNLHQVGLLPHRSFASLAHSHGPIALIHLGNVPVLVVSTSGAAREIMKTHDVVFASRPKSRTVEKLLYNYKDVAMSPYGEYWRQVRSLCVLHLLSNKRVQSFRAVREQETTRMVEKIADLCSSGSSSSRAVDLSQVFTLLPNNVVCRLALGRRYDGVDGSVDLTNLLVELAELIGVFNIGDYIPWLGWVNHVTGLEARVERVSRVMDKFLDKVIREHKDTEKRGDDHMDFVNILLWIKRDNVVGFPIGEETIKALILDMFGAGTHTSSTLLSWTMAELLRHPQVMKKLQDEVRGIANEVINEDDLENLPYLKAVIKETLRLHPPLPLLIFRESREDVKVMGYDIEAGTQVMINAWLIARDPATWERAEEFWPDRFLSCSIDFKGHDFEFIPFGAGRRSCPGIRFAMEVVELGLAKIVQRFDWSLTGGEDLDMSEASGLAITRKYPLVAVATPHITKY